LFDDRKGDYGRTRTTHTGRCDGNN
jgi:hypothetical protein